MKSENFFIAALLFLFALVACSIGQTTFSGMKADWNASGTTKNPHIVRFLEKNWTGSNQLELQSLADQVGLSCEFLWKVSPDQVEKTILSKSSFLTGEKADSVEVVFYPDGQTYFTLYSQGKISGHIRGWTSSKRGKGVEYSQLSAGDYKVTGFNPHGYSETFNSPMPNQILLSDEADERKISIHTGDISGEKLGINEYHGCIRVGELSGKQLMRLLSKGTTVKVIWK